MKDGKKSCFDCHSYPHTKPGFVTKEHYNDYWKGKLSETQMVSCQHCHAEDSGLKERQGEDHISCKKCHIEVPHDFNFWSHTSAGKEDGAKCASCHGEDKLRYHKNKGEYPVNPPKRDCKMCHIASDVSKLLKKKPHGHQMGWPAHQKIDHREWVMPVKTSKTVKKKSGVKRVIASPETP